MVAAFIAAARFRAIGKPFRPFVFFIWLGLLNETISLALIYSKGYNTVNSNIYVLLECCIILHQFYNWETLTRLLYYGLVLVAFLTWTADNFIWHRLNGNNAFFRIVYSVLITMCSIKQMGSLANTVRFSLVKNPGFLICTAFLFYYTCKAFVEVFNGFHLPVSHVFSRNMFTILYFVNFISNIIYAIALLCIPAKQVFTMPY